MKPSKTTSRKCCAGSIPPRKPPAAETGALWLKNELTKSQTTHCFSAISDYIAAQRVRCARSFWPGFLFGRKSSFGRRCPPELFERDPEKWVPVFRRDRTPAIV